VAEQTEFEPPVPLPWQLLDEFHNSLTSHLGWWLPSEIANLKKSAVFALDKRNRHFESGSLHHSVHYFSLPLACDISDVVKPEVASRPDDRETHQWQPQSLELLFQNVVRDLGALTLLAHNIDGRVPSIFRKGITKKTKSRLARAPGLADL